MLKGERTLCCIVSSGVSRQRLLGSHSQPAPLTVDRLRGETQGIVLFRLNRAVTRNALSALMVSQWHEALCSLKHDKEARVLIIKSDVPGAFSSGADLKERRTMPVEQVPAFVESLRSLADSIARLPLPTIAAIDGFALGGGLEMALACDIRVAHARAKMGLTETKLAIIPGAGGTQRLSRLIGPSRAKELIFTARVFDGEEAARLGVVNEVVDGEREDAAYQKSLLIAQEILPRGPIALKMAKMAVDWGWNTDIDTGMQIEKACTALITNTKDRLEGLTAFNEKRAPVYKGE